MTFLKHGHGWSYVEDGSSEALADARVKLRDAFEQADAQLAAALAMVRLLESRATASEAKPVKKKAKRKTKAKAKSKVTRARRRGSH